MTRRRVISIHDYPEHLNPFREDEEELQWKCNRKERTGLNVSSHRGTPSQSPVKPERPPLPNRTRHKDKENEVASPDEDKYFRQGAKPKKKRPAPMPPSPNQQKMTPAVSDGSLDSTTGSTFPNVTEVPETTENSPTKGQINSPQKQAIQEPSENGDSAPKNGMIPGEDIVRSTDEIRPTSEEQKSSSEGGMQQNTETKSEKEESCTQIEPVHSHEETKHQVDEPHLNGDKEKSKEEITPINQEESLESEENKTDFSKSSQKTDIGAISEVSNAEETDPILETAVPPTRCSDFQEQKVETSSAILKEQEEHNEDETIQNGMEHRSSDISPSTNQPELQCQ